MRPGSDTSTGTADRSLAHWSEAGRAGMEAFYALAEEDYRQLALADDWAAVLRSRAGAEAGAEAGAGAGARSRLRLLDVACGSGKFPAALLRHGLADATDLTVAVDLLDPSAFSLAEAAAVLAPPLVPAARHEVALEDFDPAHGPYDVAWATHALYAVPPDRLDRAAGRMVAALRPGGLGVVAHATAASHYLAFYEAYRATYAPDVSPFTDAGQVVAALRGQGVTPAVRTLRYPTRSADRAVVEGFLQRCAFDDTVPLARMESGDGPLAAYLGGCRDGEGYRFDHEVALITWS